MGLEIGGGESIYMVEVNKLPTTWGSVFVSPESQSSHLCRSIANDISGSILQYLPMPKVDGRIWPPT